MFGGDLLLVLAAFVVVPLKVTTVICCLSHESHLFVLAWDATSDIEPTMTG